MFIVNTNVKCPLPKKSIQMDIIFMIYFVTLLCKKVISLQNLGVNTTCVKNSIFLRLTKVNTFAL